MARSMLGRNCVLIVSLDRFGPHMAGPAIRAWEMATHLSDIYPVRLLVQSAGELDHKRFGLAALSRSSIKDALKWCDVVVFQGHALHLYPEIVSSGKAVVADLYDPFHLESLETGKEDAEPEQRFRASASEVRVINEQLRMADFLICASEKQRDFWLGQLAAVGRINPLTYDMDPSMRSLIDVVPFGISETLPKARVKAIRSSLSLGQDDKIFIWGGGIYDWFDPLTLIRAMKEVSSRIPILKLFFMGTGHPNPGIPKMKMERRAIEMASELELLNKNVFFNEGWVPYEERADYLLDADAGVSCHVDHLETSFSFRTRVLDYIWAGLPVLTTGGDALGELVRTQGLGLSIRPGDVRGWIEGLDKIANDQSFVNQCKARIEELRPDLYWQRTLDPLMRFCASPRKAPDALVMFSDINSPSKNPIRLAGRVKHYWRSGGWEMVRVQTRKYLQRLRGRSEAGP